VVATHGTSTSYVKHGCRCEDCRAWQRNRIRAQRTKNRGSVRRPRTFKEANVLPAKSIPRSVKKIPVLADTPPASRGRPRSPQPAGPKPPPQPPNPPTPVQTAYRPAPGSSRSPRVIPVGNDPASRMQAELGIDRRGMINYSSAAPLVTRPSPPHPSPRPSPSPRGAVLFSGSSSSPATCGRGRRDALRHVRRP
jgi:hypothetical protein